MITHIKENNPESKEKVLIGEIRTPADPLVDGESSAEDMQQSDTTEVKVWKNKGVKCYIRESQTLING